MATLTDFYIKQGDTAEAIVIRAEYDNGDPILEDLTGADVEVHMKSSAGTLLIAAGVGSVTDDPDNPDPAAPMLIGYQWQTGDTDVASPTVNQPHELEFQLTLADGRILTVPNATNIRVHVMEQIA